MKVGNVITENAIEDMGIWYFPVLNGNSLYSYNKETGASKRLCNLMPPKYPTPHFRLCEALAVYEGKVFFAPSYGDAFLGVYDINSERVEWIDVKGCVSRGNDKGTLFKFCQCIPYNGFIYFIGAEYPAIIKLNMLDYKIEVIKEYEGKKSFFILGNAIRENFVYLTYAEEPKVLILNLSDDSIKEMDILGDYRGFSGIAIDDRTKTMYLNVSDSELVLKVDKKGEVQKCYSPPGWYEKNAVPIFENMTEVDNGFLLFPVNADAVMQFDYRNEKFSILEVSKEIVQHSRQSGYKGGRSVFSFSPKKGTVCLVEISTKIWHEITLSDGNVNTFTVSQAINGIIDSWRNGVVESKECNIEDYVKLLSI